jgi:tetratricopeptide (TPR) repeat protein
MLKALISLWERSYRQSRKWIVYPIALSMGILLLCCGRQPTMKVNMDYGLAAQPVPLYENLGSHHHRISTTSSQAQRYFDQGLTLLYGFNHGEAVRSFAMAAKLDPDCAICHWGIALALGPNINAPMKPEAVAIAWKETQTALALSHRTGVTQSERDYIQALQPRYQPRSGDRRKLDRDYARSMQELHRRYLQDTDAATLFAEAVMDTRPWDYWENDKPRPEMQPAIAALETAIKLDPTHPGAHHYYIHLMESAPDGKTALPSAEKLGQIVPGIAHLVHMPSHIFQRLGRYRDSVLANQNAIAADRLYLGHSQPSSEYYHNYVTHNYHFLWSSAVLLGQGQLAIQTARDIASQSQLDTLSTPGVRQNFIALPLYTLTQFERWSEILQSPKPQDKYVEGVWHYARGMALAHRGQWDLARAELRSLTALAKEPNIATLKIWEQPATKFLQVTVGSLSGTLAEGEGNRQKAIADLTTAWKDANQLSYSEFGNWFSAIGYSLGQLLLKADRPQEAASIYQQELSRYPDNGWSLFGLAASLKAQGKIAAAKEIKQQAIAAWKYADFPIGSIDRV